MDENIMTVKEECNAEDGLPNVTVKIEQVVDNDELVAPNKPYHQENISHQANYVGVKHEVQEDCKIENIDCEVANYTCCFCGASYSLDKQGLYLEHTIKCSFETSDDKFSIQTSEDTDFICRICDKSFSTSVHLKTHLIIHTAEHVCNVCEKVFSQRKYLTKHKKIHTKEKPFVCNLCEKSYSARCCLTKHKTINHSEENPFVCNLCDEAFSRNKYFIQHKKVHAGGLCAMFVKKHSVDDNI